MSDHNCVCFAECGNKVFSARFFLCRDCSRKYGFTRETWPEWLLFLVSDEQRTRRQDKQYDEMLSLDEVMEKLEGYYDGED